MLYTYGRAIVGVDILIKTVTCAENHLIIKLMGTGMIVQSLYFIYTMLFILKQRSKEYSERKRKGIKMLWFKAMNKKDFDGMDSYKRGGSKVL